MHSGSRGKASGKLVNTYLRRDLELAHEAEEMSYPISRAAPDLVLAFTGPQGRRGELA
jgi:hypothetical protein